MAPPTPAPKPPLYVEHSQPPIPLRPMECTTEARFLESLFLLTDDARSSHNLQLYEALPHLNPTKNVVRFMNLKLDIYDPNIFPSSSSNKPIAGHGQQRSQPPWKQFVGRHFRVVTRITALGRTSIKMQHRLLTVPNSQIHRDFNDRGQDAQHQQLQEDDEPERQFASAEGALVFILWQQDEKTGHQFFRPHPGPFQDSELFVRPPFVKLLREQAPERRDVVSKRPENAFRFELHLRKSDEDELGHVTNSRYTALLYEVLSYGLNAGYYANGSGPFKAHSPLPRSASQTAPDGSRFYKDANILELFVGFENELKVKPGRFVWSWVEREKINNHLDVVQFEICTEGEQGEEKILSLCRVIIREYQRPTKKASL